MEPYFEEIKKLMPDLPICIGGAGYAVAGTDDCKPER